MADQHGMYIGAAGDASQYSDPEYVRLLTQEFNMVAAENAMKWQVLHPEPDRYDFSAGDALVAFAKIHHLAVYGHVLVWDYGYPAWVAEGNRSRDEWIQLLCTHVKTVASHYRGQIYAWDVVNEAFENNGTLRKTLWMQAIGPEYIAMAFQWARESDPGALLILNDHFGEGLNAKSEAIYALVQGLLQMGVPIDGVGMQMHLWLWGPPTSQELEANMQRLADLDLDVHITEMDVRTQLSLDNEEMKLAAQADTYRQAFAACLATQRCKVFVTWGLTDRYSWIPGYTGSPDAPLLFDENGQPKPAYFAIQDLLKNP
jgi:endo-1,4-beta-xylanase